MSATQFSGRGQYSEESIVGADGAVILDVKFKNTEFRKFYLFQAKKSIKSFKFDEKSIDQKYKMLFLCPDSFFLIYDKRFYFIPAFVVGLRDGLKKLPRKDFIKFHKDFFNCFIGDHSVRLPWLPFFFPLHRYWHYPFWEDFADFYKFNKLPLAKDNLLIEIKYYE